MRYGMGGFSDPSREPDVKPGSWPQLWIRHARIKRDSHASRISRHMSNDHTCSADCLSVSGGIGTALPAVEPASLAGLREQSTTAMR